MTIVRALIEITVNKGWQILQLDVNNAFLHGDLHEEVYMEVPPGLVVERPGLVEGSVVFVVVYVDDVLVTGTHLQEIESLKDFLHNTFKIKDLGRLQLHYFLGLEVQYTDKGVLMSQKKFTMDLLKKFGCIDCPPMTSPLDSSVKLKSVNAKSQGTTFEGCISSLKYLKGDPTLGIFLTNDADYRVKAFYDSYWATCPQSRKSVSGYIVLLGDNPISWKSKKQSTISLSSAEAKYRSTRMVVGELVWLARLLTELIVPLSLPIPIFCDSQAALHIARNPVFHESTKHIEVDCHFVRDQLQEGLIFLHHISTNN
uniref:Uncharacterized mitochondrial protein AtMg00810-like n=1 Tax=Nicotiana tabacum TaxID=4097 RepID=A0A1S3ZMH1_TOBAC|nr:PREDICTED: uncharacterized mitochondrial protein AtMg00810-like [Nicotiana tabacum]